MNNFDTGVQLRQPQPLPAATELLSFLSYRVAKINQATLLIASYIPDAIIIKSQLINSALVIMSDTHQIELEPENVIVRDISKIITALRQMKDLFEIAYRGGFISDMNAKMLATELDGVTAFIQEKIMTYCIGDVIYPFRMTQMILGSEQKDIQSVLSDIINADNRIANQSDIKRTTTEGLTQRPQTTAQSTPSKNQSSEISKLSEVFKKETPSAHSTEHTKTSVSKADHNQYSSLHFNPIKSVSGEDKKERRDAIMRTIRSKGQVTIKDISENINGCSEKTIQRDLQELIQHGVLMREGEKRWAVYKLAMKNV